jgi:hypothetical protein
MIRAKAGEVRRTGEAAIASKEGEDHSRNIGRDFPSAGSRRLAANRRERG